MKMITLKEAAEMIGIGATDLRNRIRRFSRIASLLGAEKRGRDIFVSERGVRAYIAERQAKGI